MTEELSISDIINQFAKDLDKKITAQMDIKEGALEILAADSVKFKKLSEELAKENEVLKLETTEMKEELEKLKAENTELLKAKEDNERMSSMLGKLNIEWMESKGLSPTCKICQEIYDTNEHFQTTLNCGHAFGESCIKQSLELNKRCPVCNKKAEIADVSRVY